MRQPTFAYLLDAVGASAVQIDQARVMSFTTPNESPPRQIPTMLLVKGLQFALRRMGASVPVSGKLDHVTGQALDVAAGRDWPDMTWADVYRAVVSSLQRGLRLRKIIGTAGSLHVPVGYGSGEHSSMGGGSGLKNALDPNAIPVAEASGAPDSVDQIQTGADMKAYAAKGYRRTAAWVKANPEHTPAGDLFAKAARTFYAVWFRLHSDITGKSAGMTDAQVNALLPRLRSAETAMSQAYSLLHTKPETGSTISLPALAVGAGIIWYVLSAVAEKSQDARGRLRESRGGAVTLAA